MAANNNIDVKLVQIIYYHEIADDEPIEYDKYVNLPLNVKELRTTYYMDLLLFMFTGTPAQILAAVDIHPLIYFILDGERYEGSDALQRLKMLSRMRYGKRINVYVAAEIEDVVTGNGVGMMMNEYMNAAYPDEFNDMVTSYEESRADRA